LRGAALALSLACGSVVLAGGLAAAQEKPSAPQTTPQTKSDSAATPSTGKAQQEKTTPLRKALKEKKVLTEDDLRPRPKVSPENEDVEKEFDPICDPSCEEMVRSEMPPEPDRELEFRNQFKIATQEIARDHVWNSALYETRDTGWAFCGFKRKYPQPITMEPLDLITKEQDLWMKFGLAELRMKNRMDNVQSFDALRAVIMKIQASEVLRGSCKELRLPPW
jgi:hypothetical protein